MPADTGSMIEQRGARRQVTVMFVDLVDFSNFASTADAEDLQEWLDGFYDRVRRIVEAEGGEITEFLGDGVVGVFGLARAEELAARKAVEAAMRAVSLADLSFPGGQAVRLRAGVATGEVATRHSSKADGPLPRMTGMVTTLAQRLQVEAEPGEVLIAPETRDLLRGALPLTPRAQTRLKGFDRALTVYRVTQTALRDRTAEAQPHRFVGRRQERERIIRAGRPCLLVGPAGIGKSALARTFLRGDRPQLCLYADAIKSRHSYHPFLDLLRSAIGAERPDFMALTATFPRLDTDGHLALALILGLPEGQTLPGRFASSALSARIDAALEAAVLDRLGDGVLLVEDLHWLDNASFGALRRLVARTRSGRPLVLMTSRESVKINRYLSGLPVEIIPLDGLPPTDASLFVNSFGGQELAADARADLIRQAGGVPLYLDQLLKHAGRRERRRDAVPATLSDLLNERIDASGAARPVLLQAAVLGRTFPIRLLEALAAPAGDIRPLLDDARQAGIVEPVGKDVWSFSHALLQRAAYSQLLRGTREALHGRVAELMQGDCAELVDRGPAVLAGHQALARLHLPAAENYLAASRVAMMQGAFSDAEEHARAALEMSRQAEPSAGAPGAEIAAQTALGSILTQMHGYAAPDVRAAYDEVLRMSSQRDEGRTNTAALFGSYSHAIISGDLSRADKLCELLISAADEAEAAGSSDRVEMRLAADTAANCGYFYSGSFERQVPHLSRIRATYDIARHAPMIARFGMDMFAAAQMFELPSRVICGELDRLDELLAETDAHQQALNIPVMQPYALIWGAVPLYHAGRTDEALARLQRGLRCAEDQGAVFWQLAGQCWHHVMDPSQSATGEGRAQFTHSIEALRAIGALILLPYFTAHAALALSEAGDPLAGFALSRDAVHEGARSRLLGWQPETLRLHAGIAQRIGRSESAARILHEAIRLARRQGARLWHLRAAADLAALPDGDPAPLAQAIAALDRPEHADAVLSRATV